MHVRRGAPLGSGVYGITDILRDSAYATTLGLVLWQARNREPSAWQGKRSGMFGGIARMLRRLFHG